MDSRLRELSLLGIGEAAPEILCPIWFLQLKRDTEKLGKVQLQATKILMDVEHMAY